MKPEDLMCNNTWGSCEKGGKHVCGHADAWPHDKPSGCWCKKCHQTGGD